MKPRILEVVHALLAASPKGVSVDRVAKRLRELGVVFPPNSPRLVTRLRQFKEELQVSGQGLVSARASPSASPAPTR